MKGYKNLKLFLPAFWKRSSFKETQKIKIANLNTKRLKDLEARLTTTTAKLDKANRKLAEHENGQDHDHQPVSSTLVTRRLDEIQNRVNILELSDHEMESTLTTVKSDVDLVDNLVKKTDLISKVIPK